MTSLSRIERLRATFNAQQLDAILITDEINVRYLSGFTGDSSYLLVTPDAATMLSDGRYTTQLSLECPEFAVALRPPRKTMLNLVGEQIGAAKTVRVGFESTAVSVALHAEIKKRCPAVTWLPTQGLVETLRCIKDETEIARVIEAIEIAERAYRSVTAKLRPDWTEIEIAHELESTMRFLGGEGVSFAAIIGAGPAAALPHYRPRRERLNDTSVLLMDFGAKFEGYASDITRTLGGPRVSTRFRTAHAAVLEAQLAAIDRIAPGVRVSEIDAAARDVLARHGLAEAFVHGLGHGIGLQIHEAPRMSAISDETLQAGMIVTVEPGVYFEGEFGIRIEDDVLVTDSGHRVLSSLPKGLDDCPLML